MNRNKELRSAYKQIKFKIGVFQIRNTSNQKIYVGSSLNLDAIWNRMKSELKFRNHRNTALQQAWNESGEEGFRYEILSEIEQREGVKVDYAKEVKTLEEMFIEELQPFGEKGYHSIKTS